MDQTILDNKVTTSNGVVEQAEETGISEVEVGTLDDSDPKMTDTAEWADTSGTEDSEVVDGTITNDQGVIVYNGNAFAKYTLKDHDRQFKLDRLKEMTAAASSKGKACRLLTDWEDKTEYTALNTSEDEPEEKSDAFGLPPGMAAIDLVQAFPPTPIPSRSAEEPRKRKSFWIRFFHGLHRRISFLLPRPLKKVKRPAAEVEAPPSLISPVRIDDGFDEVDLN